MTAEAPIILGQKIAPLKSGGKRSYAKMELALSRKQRATSVAA
jgi:hypothetical protein